MGALAIVLAIILCAWVYAALHPYNEDTRDKIGVQLVTIGLTISAIVLGVLEAVL